MLHSGSADLREEPKGRQTMAKYEFRLGNELRRLLYFVLGNSCYAFAIQLFLAGNNIAAGGFSGIAIVLSSVLRSPSAPLFSCSIFRSCFSRFLSRESVTLC